MEKLFRYEVSAILDIDSPFNLRKILHDFHFSIWLHNLTTNAIKSDDNNYTDEKLYVLPDKTNWEYICIYNGLKPIDRPIMFFLETEKSVKHLRTHQERL